MYHLSQVPRIQSEGAGLCLAGLMKSQHDTTMKLSAQGLAQDASTKGYSLLFTLLPITRYCVSLQHSCKMSLPACYMLGKRGHTG